MHCCLLLVDTICRDVPTRWWRWHAVRIQIVKLEGIAACTSFSGQLQSCLPCVRWKSVRSHLGIYLNMIWVGIIVAVPILGLWARNEVRFKRPPQFSMTCKSTYFGERHIDVLGTAQHQIHIAQSDSDLGFPLPILMAVKLYFDEPIVT